MTNQPDTWKKKLRFDLVSGELVGRVIFEKDSYRLEAFIESLLSTRTALAQKEGVREAMRVVEKIKGIYITKSDSEGTEDLAFVSKRSVVQALQEKLDTKGE